MANLASMRCGFYRIPLPVVLSDSTHGEMRAFELNTVRLTDAEGAGGQFDPDHSEIQRSEVTALWQIAEALNTPGSAAQWAVACDLGSQCDGARLT